jgi:hypothetical protein
MQKLKAYYQVNKIRSQKAIEREKLEDNIEKHIGNFLIKQDAINVYNNTSIGVEVDKQLLFIDEEKNICKEIKSTFQS